MSKYNAANLIEAINSEGFVSDEGLPDFIIAQQKKKPLPLYLMILTGIGAFIALFCFVVFLAATYIIDFYNEVNLLIWGVIFISGAIVIQKFTNHKNIVKQSFFIQSSLAFIVVGQLLLFIAVTSLLDSFWTAIFVLVILTSITYYFYHLSVDRFLSSFGLLLFVWTDLFGNDQTLLFNGFFLVQLVVAGLLLTDSKVKNDYIPLAYALVFSLSINVLFVESFVVNIFVAIGLIALFAWVAEGRNKLKTQPLLLACIGALLLGIISAPSILFAIALMVLGYAKHEKKLTIIGGLLMPVFLFYYYYNLEVSLLVKSLILIGSGMVLLVGRFYMQYKGWSKGVKS